MDVRARTLGYSETIRARTARQIRATVKQYARLAWVYLWSLERVFSFKPQANVDTKKILESVNKEDKERPWRLVPLTINLALAMFSVERKRNSGNA